jgi:putative flavoprotein involved in K+ transport
MLRSTDTVVVGAGQAGLALSYHLVRAGHAHVVLERGRVAQRWRDRRGTRALLTPNWLNRLPGSPPHEDEDGFLAVERLASYLQEHAASFGAPVEERTTVLSVERRGGGFLVQTSRGSWTARSVVVATGECELPAIPSIATALPPTVEQLHTAAYRSPEALPPGGVLVVGAGPSGQQIGLELARAGRTVTISVGRHARMPRRYRGRDVWRWLAEIGELDRTVDELHDVAAAKRSPSLPLSGVGGGEELGLDVLRAAGVRLTGRLRGFTGSHALFDDDLAANVAEAQARLQRVLAQIDARAGAAPPQVVAPVAAPLAPAVIDLADEGISTVIWATGYRRAYPWLRIPVLDANGEIVHRRGVTSVPGLYALGLRLQWTRSSHFIGGVGDDAAYLAQLLTDASAALAA